MSELVVDTLKHSGNSGTANLTLAGTGAVTTADDLTVGDNLVATKQNGCQRIILEQFFTPCDGSVIACANGNITVQDVTAEQDLTTTYTDLTGSVISYQPPAGASQVIYEFYYQIGRKDTTASHLCRLYLDSDEVTQGFSNFQINASAGRVSIKWSFNIGGTADTTHGRVASWDSSKTIKIQTREYGSSAEGKAHWTVHSGNGSSTDVFVTPCIGITAIG